jgi:hypothetical protein
MWFLLLLAFGSVHRNKRACPNTIVLISLFCNFIFLCHIFKFKLYTSVIIWSLHTWIASCKYLLVVSSIPSCLLFAPFSYIVYFFYYASLFSLYTLLCLLPFHVAFCQISLWKIIQLCTTNLIHWKDDMDTHI